MVVAKKDAHKTPLKSPKIVSVKKTKAASPPKKESEKKPEKKSLVIKGADEDPSELKEYGADEIIPAEKKSASDLSNEALLFSE